MSERRAHDTRPRTLQPLGQYDPPSMAAPDTLRLKLSRLFAVFSSSKEGAFIGDDQLQQVTIDTLDNVVAPPACGPVIGELEVDLGRWLADPDATHVRGSCPAVRAERHRRHLVSRPRLRSSDPASLFRFAL